MSNNKLQSGLLPKDPVQAVQKLIKLSSALLDLAERETQALVQNNTMSFAILQDEKELLADQYTKVSEEFRARLEDFRRMDRGLLARLEGIQKKLAEKMHSNGAIVAQMRSRAEKITQSSLITAQELGQSKPVKFPNGNTRQERI